MKVLTFGVFDYFHYGHLKLFERARALGDYLIVAVQRTEEIHKNKPEAKILYSLEQRIEIIESIRYVDKVVLYADVSEDIKKIDFDIFVVGGDQNNNSFLRAIDWCKANNKEVIVLSRTPNICSSQIKDNID